MPRAPVSTEEPTSLKSRTETALKKYRGLSEDVGPFDKIPLSPIVEEKDEPQYLGMEHVGPEKRPEEETIVVFEEQSVLETDVELHQASLSSLEMSRVSGGVVMSL